jgi:hypothetical protein
MMGLLPSSILVLILATVAPPTREAGLEPFLQKTFDAYGGLEALSQPFVIRQTGIVHSKFRQSNDTWELERIFEAPRRLRVEITYPGSEKEVRLLVGSLGFRNGEPVSGPPRDAMLIQAGRLALPLLLHRHASGLIDRGVTRRGEQSLRRLELALGGAVVLTVEIDVASGLIVHTTGTFLVGGQAAPDFSVAYSDFREVGGILFPFREANYVGGRHVADTLIERIELLESASPKTFQPQRLSPHR